MFTVRIDVPSLAHMDVLLIQQLRNKRAFLKNWANASAQEARANARNKRGRRWWKDLARSVQVKSVNDSAIDVGTSYRGAALKQYGGEIRPDKAKALTIPIADEAKGKTAYDFERTGKKLFTISQKTGDPGTIGVLGYETPSKTKGETDFRPLFVLRTRVYQKPDAWFPSDTDVQRLARREAQLLLNKEQRQWNSR